MNIDWEKITIREAKLIADQLCCAFSVTAKCYGTKEIRDVSYLNVESRYDDNFHSETSRKECGVSKELDVKNNDDFNDFKYSKSPDIEKLFIELEEKICVNAGDNK